MSVRMLSCSTLLAAAAASCWSFTSQAATVSIDDFQISRNGGLFFRDTFGDGLPPPSAPDFPSGTPATYNVFGTIPANAESGGFLTLNTANGDVSANALDQTRIAVRARLNTNIDPLDLTAGLKSDDTLSLTGIFRLSPLTGILNPQYAIRFADTPGGDVGNHQLLQLQVRTDTTTGLTTVRYILQDFDANTISVLGEAPVAPPAGADEILLNISRPSTANNNFVGSFAYLTGGITGPTTAFAQTGQMFQGENFVRAEFNISDGVLAAVPEPESYAMLLAGLGLLGFAARCRKHNIT